MILPVLTPGNSFVQAPGVQPYAYRGGGSERQPRGKAVFIVRYCTILRRGCIKLRYQWKSPLSYNEYMWSRLFFPRYLDPLNYAQQYP